MIIMEKVSKKLLSERQVNWIYKSLNLLDSYKVDFQEYYNEYSEKVYLDNFDSQNKELTNEDNIKFQVKWFEQLYIDFLHNLYKLIYIDIVKFCNNDNIAFSYKINIEDILDWWNIYTHDKVLKKSELNELNINPYDFLFKKLNDLYAEHKKNFEEIFSNDWSVLDLWEQIKMILRKDFSNGYLSWFLSVIDLAEFELLELDNFEEKASEFKDKYLNFDNKDDSNEIINNKDKILGYFELQISIYIDYFVNKLNIKLDNETDKIIDLNKLQTYLYENDVLDQISNIELKLLHELIERKYDIWLLYESLTNDKTLKYKWPYGKSSLNTIPDFKWISSILDSTDNNIKNISKEINEILF